jgi:NitT/TauT family transport system substrate-binding protein
MNLTSGAGHALFSGTPLAPYLTGGLSTMYPFLRTLIAALVVLFLLPAAPGRAASPQDAAKVTVSLQWVPQSQFAGYYLAVDKGFYRKRGLDVILLHNGPELNSMDRLADGTADFATTFLTSALRRRDSGLPLVNIAQIVNRSTAMLVARKKSGIRTLQDLNGRRVSIWAGDFAVPFEAVLASHKVSPGRRFVQNYSVALFLHNGVDACSAMYYNEYHMLYQAGLDEDELVTFPLEKYGGNVPEDGIYSLESTWKSHPLRCRDFAEATMEGWRYARAHPEEALDSVMRRVISARIPTNRAHMKWMLEKILPGILPGPADAWRAGILSRDDYVRATGLMKKQRLIRNAPDHATFHPRGESNVP